MANQIKWVSEAYSMQPSFWKVGNKISVNPDVFIKEIKKGSTVFQQAICEQYVVVDSNDKEIARILCDSANIGY